MRARDAGRSVAAPPCDAPSTILSACGEGTPASTRRSCRFRGKATGDEPFPSTTGAEHRSQLTSHVHPLPAAMPSCCGGTLLTAAARGRPGHQARADARHEQPWPHTPVNLPRHLSRAARGTRLPIRTRPRGDQEGEGPTRCNQHPGGHCGDQEETYRTAAAGGTADTQGGWSCPHAFHVEHAEQRRTPTSPKNAGGGPHP